MILTPLSVVSRPGAREGREGAVRSSGRQGATRASRARSLLAPFAPSAGVTRFLQRGG